MKTKLVLSPFPLILLAAILFSSRAGATIAGPYTADGSTLHLWHLNETAVPAADSASSGGTNLVGLLNGASLGSASFAGFGNAVNTLDGGQDAIVAANKDALITPSTAAQPGNVAFSYSDPTTGAFTFEALVWIGFDPARNLGTTANGGNNRNTFSQIMSAESGTAASRIFQFRICPLGVVPVGSTPTAVPLLTFENIRAGSSGQATIFAAIPTSGPDAIVSNQWYHVAVAYNGAPNTANNIKFYWTLLDPSRTVCNQISITSAQTTLSGPNPLGTANTPFVIGNEARNRAGNFLGMLDEVRISKVARGPGEMMFTATCVSVIASPSSQLAAAGDNVTLNVTVTGEAPKYQWQFNNTNLPNATNASLLISSITTNQAGPYRVIVTNTTCQATSDVAVVSVGGVISEVFNTGLDGNRAPLPGATTDPHYQLIQSDDPNFPGPASYVDSAPVGTWLANSANSQWISPAANGNAGAGRFTYRTSFLLDTLDPATAQLNGGWAIDNVGADIVLNGLSLGISNNAGFGSLSLFTITNGFIAGSNTLDFVTTNAAGGGINPTALRVEMRGVALPLPPTVPQITGLPANVTTQSQQSATFIVTAVGSAPLTYQWYHGATLLTGQTSRTLNLPGLTSSDGGTYTVAITNTAGFTNASATLTVVTPPALAWLGLASGDWDTLTTNWVDTSSSANVAFANLEDVIFDSRGSGAPAVNLTETLSPNSIVVDSASDYTFNSIAGNGSLAGNFTITKKNTGTLIIDNANTFSGNTLVQGGTVQIGNADTSGTLGVSAISNNAALVFNRTDTFTVPNAISGTGTVTMAGFGVAVLAGNNTYTGPTVVSSGTINVNGPAALGSAASGTTVSSGAQLFIDANANLGPEPLTLSGFGPNSDGALRKGGGGAGNIFGGPITLAADTGIQLDNNGPLNFTNLAGITGTDVGLSVQGLNAASIGTVRGPITLGAGSFTEFGPGTWVFTSLSNNWSGTTTINTGGILQIGDGGANGSLGGSTINNAGTLTFLSAANLTITNVLSGGGPVNQNGTGTLLFSGNSSYGGTTTLRGSGVLRITADTALGSGTCAIGSAQTDTCRLEVMGGLTIANPITIFPRVFFGTGAGGFTDVAPQILNVSGTNTLSSATSITIPGGGNNLTLESDSGKLVLAAGVTAGGVGRNLVLSGPAAGEIQGAVDHTGGNSVLVWKIDAGVWTLWGTNTPNASTTISNGTLYINGSMDTNLITVAGGTLAGTGVLSGPLVVNAGATLSPGAFIGTLTVSNSLTLKSGSTAYMEINKTGATMDQIVGLSSITYGGTLVVSNFSGTLAAGDFFKLFDAANYSGTFAGISPATPGAGLVWNTNTLSTDGTLRVQVPVASAPSFTGISFDGSHLVLTGSGGPSNGGYSVVTSTNVTAALSNWTTIAFGAFDASGHFAYTNVINPATSRSFFRLRVP